MKIELFGYTIYIEVSKTVANDIKKRRRKADLVLSECNYSSSKIERVKAVKRLGASMFPELEWSIDFDGFMIGLREAKEWVESAFLDNGTGGIA